MKKTISYNDQEDLRKTLLDMLSEVTKKIVGPESVYSLLEKHHGDEQEGFFVIVLDGANQPIKTIQVTKGLINRTVVHPREVYRIAIMLNAGSIVVAHNHPSQNLSPSSEDVDITERLIKAGDVLGIRLLDHIIFAKSGFRSMRESGDVNFSE